MSECIIKAGELWRNCPHHKNIEGGFGEFACVYVYRKKGEGWQHPQFCKLKENELPEELFVI